MVFQFVFSFKAFPTEVARKCFLFGVLRFCVEFQFVLSGEAFLTDVASECFLSRVYEKVPGEMVSLLECPATLHTLVLPRCLYLQLRLGSILVFGLYVFFQLTFSPDLIFTKVTEELETLMLSLNVSLKVASISCFIIALIARIS